MNISSTTKYTAILAILTSHAYAGDSMPSFDPNAGDRGNSAPISLPISTNDIYSNDISQGKILQTITGLSNHQKVRTRGLKESAIFREASPSVVLVMTNEGFGSGSYIGNDLILTNWHVIEGYNKVGVAFKPEDSNNVSKDDIVIAKVIKRDEVKDLALLKVEGAPEYVEPLEISRDNEFEVGSDVHAIGHPNGLSWSYTKGIISQYRPEYKWQYSKAMEHLASVIQTQTPINGGNSGGPLLSEDKKIIGVNSFKGEGEALNFAVAAPSIREFMNERTDVIARSQEPSNPKQPGNKKSDCKSTVLFEGRNKKNDADMRQVSINCDSWPDITFVAPDDTSKPIIAFIDSHKRSKPDGIIYDYDRKGKWKISYWDPELDDTFPLVGFHPNGEILPSSYSRRCKTGKPSTDRRCI